MPAIAADFKVPPTPDHYVTDNAGALSSATRASLENELHAYETATGHQSDRLDRTNDRRRSVGDVDRRNRRPLEDRPARSRRRRGALSLHARSQGSHRGRLRFGERADRRRLVSHHRETSSVRGCTPAMSTAPSSSGVAAMLTTISPSYKGVTPPPEASDCGRARMAAVVGGDRDRLIVHHFILIVVNADHRRAFAMGIS